MVTTDLIRMVNQILRPIRVRLANTMARFIVSLVDDAPALQRVQLKGAEIEEGEENREVIGDAEHFQPYGFFAVPFDGAEAIVLFPNGDRGHPLVLAVSDRRHRPTGGQPGEAGLFTDEGDEIRLKRGHVIVLNPNSGEVRLGSSTASDPVSLKSDLTTLKNAISNAAVVAGDGGAAFKANILAALTSWPVGATKVKGV